MSAHTPGPWAAIGTDVKTPGPRSRILCWTGQPEVEMGEARANARLIAAAPDMLAALREVAEYLGPESVPEYPSVQTATVNALIRNVRAAIAKMEG